MVVSSRRQTTIILQTTHTVPSTTRKVQIQILRAPTMEDQPMFCGHDQVPTKISPTCKIGITKQILIPII